MRSVNRNKFWLVGVLILITGLAQGQTCNSAISPTAPDSRYKDNSDGTVTDSHTGLMWQQCSVGQSGNGCTTGSAQRFTWDTALQFEESLNSSGGFAGHSDWFVPDRNELASLMEDACYEPSINVTLFPNTTSRIGYWSSSPFSRYGDDIWYVGFSHSSVGLSTYRDVGLVVRLVRLEQ